MSVSCVIAIGVLVLGADARLLKHDKQEMKLDITKGKFAVVLDKDMKTQMLVQIREKGAQPIKDPCEAITCGALKCPTGFTETKFEGHCSPYCYNPDIKIEAMVKG